MNNNKLIIPLVTGIIVKRKYLYIEFTDGRLLRLEVKDFTNKKWIKQ